MRKLIINRLELKLKEIRKCFFISQFLIVGGFCLAFIIAILFEHYVNTTASIVSFGLIVMVSFIARAYYEGEYLISKCPNCNAYFYPLFKWPLIGWVVFLFFSNCKGCGLNLHAKNISKYGANDT